MIPQDTDARSGGTTSPIATGSIGSFQRIRLDMAKRWVCLLLAAAPFALMIALWSLGFR